MAIRAKKLNLYLRFDTGNWDGFGHAIRSLELAKELNKKFNIFICTNINSKRFIKSKYSFIFKKKNEDEIKFILRVANTNKDNVLYIDKNYNYSSDLVKILNKKFIKIFFYQNFSKGIQNENIIINPTPNLNKSKNLKKKFSKIKIYSGNKYLIIPNFYSKKKTNNLGISFGSSDPKNISIKILKLLIKMKWKVNTFLFLGIYSNLLNKIKRIKLPKNIRILKFDKNKFFSSRLALCAPGITAFELLNNNIFGLYVSHSKTHYDLGMYIQKKYNFSKNIDIYYNLSFKKFKKNLIYFWNKEITKKKQKKMNLFNNSCKKVAKIIIDETK